MESTKKEKSQESNQLSRKTMLGTLAGGAVVAATGLSLPQRVLASGITDYDILNFALNLEYLEAEFYTYATTGYGISHFGIPTGGVGDSGPTFGGKKVAIDGIRLPVSLEIAQDERDHVLDLRSLLGNKAIAKPAIKLDALGIGFANEGQFLVLARAFEDTGVSAYCGAAPLIQSKTILGYAARILAVEALHSGNIRLMVAQEGLATMKVDSQDVLPPPSGNHYFTTDDKGLAITRTVQQVIAIVKPFFPDGINGNIQ